MAHLLIVDDEQSICWGLSKLAEEMGHTASVAASAEQAFDEAQRAKPDAIVLDVRLPGMDGLEAMRRFGELLGPTPIIVITAYGDLDTAVKAVRQGAFDYVTKPFELRAVQRSIERALRPVPAGAEVTPAQVTAVDQDLIVGTSPAMQRVFKRIALVSASEACVHLRGESGTGKELAARAIHRHSRRNDGPFVAVNLASLSPTLAESELFGHVRGAFTGADEPKKGFLEHAHGGTLFLDEVADIPLSIQVKLLRALEHGEVLPVGANRPVPTDFRVISATHQNLAERVADGAFRHDLYFRLVTFEIEIPPLRQRSEDIRPLVEHFLHLLAAKNDRPVPAVSDETLAQLERLPWHGNVRELRNAIEHATVLARGAEITVEHLPPPTPATVSDGAVPPNALASLIRQWAVAALANPDESGDLYAQFQDLVEPAFLEAVLEHYHGQCAPAARRLGLHRTTLRKKLDQFGIDES
ncbi:MAG: sigma-54-dependent Fis family transcriptional regulator [Pirellulales bacterium]|nr:sigma-54-dependent Fis family transcriptional regulator [Pirellulales bacterium]